MLQDIINKNEIATDNSIKLIETSLTEIGIEASTQTETVGLTLTELQGLDRELTLSYLGGGGRTCLPKLFSFVTAERLKLGSWNFASLTLCLYWKKWRLICFSKINTVTMATVLFQVTENCENRENAITHCFFMGLLQILHSGVKMVVARWQACKCSYMWRHVTVDVITWPQSLVYFH